MLNARETIQLLFYSIPAPPWLFVIKVLRVLCSNFIEFVVYSSGLLNLQGQTILEDLHYSSTTMIRFSYLLRVFNLISLASGETFTWRTNSRQSHVLQASSGSMGFSSCCFSASPDL